MFGLSIDAPQVRYWGARAIYKNQEIDLLPNRQTSSISVASPEAEDDKSFIRWINGHALPWLRSQVKELSLDSADPQVITLSQFKYELRACTNASYGFLYIGVIEHKVVETEPQINPTSKEVERVVMIGDRKFVVDRGVVPVGTKGIVKVNNLGPAEVVGYYNENYAGGYLVSLMVRLENPPQWWLTQTKNRELDKLVKAGKMPVKRGTMEVNTRSSEYKDWNAGWKHGPIPIFANDLVPEASS